MELLDIVMKLNGPVKPIGASHVDRDRLENLKSLIDLAHSIQSIIDDVYCDASHHHEKSIKEAGNEAQKFLNGTLKIERYKTL